MSKIYIHTTAVSNKLNYVLDFVFKVAFDEEYELITDKADSNSKSCINYQAERSDSKLSIPISGYFDSTSLDAPSFDRELVSDNEVLNFDLFAAIFYLLARVEEYQDSERDEHDRFKMSNSILYEKKLLHLPVIDLWLQSFKEILESKGIPIRMNRSYAFQSTIDVDHIYAYKHKSVGVKIMSSLRDVITFRGGRLYDRFFLKNDPYYRFSDILSWHQDLGIAPKFFMLTSERSDHDKSLSPSSIHFRNVVELLSSKADIGIHPSYYSEEKNLIGFQKELLETITGQTITNSRQHYLRVKLPHTNKDLIANNISQDHSMGFAESIGFRSGTSYEHKWYDLENDQVTELSIMPFQVMDVTLNKYMDLAPQEALNKVNDIIQVIKSVNGTFSLIWHNSSFYDREGWKGWEDAYKQILKLAS